MEEVYRIINTIKSPGLRSNTKMAFDTFYKSEPPNCIYLAGAVMGCCTSCMATKHLSMDDGNYIIDYTKDIMKIRLKYHRPDNTHK